MLCTNTYKEFEKYVPVERYVFSNSYNQIFLVSNFGKIYKFSNVRIFNEFVDKNKIKYYLIDKLPEDKNVKTFKWINYPKIKM